MACDASNTAPSQTSQPAPLNLAGTWSGTMRQPGSQGGSTITVVWVVTQTGSRVSIAETVSEPRRSTYNGSLSGTLAGDQLSLTETVPQGNIPGFAQCSISGSGTLSASRTSISGTITAAFSSCETFNFFSNPNAVIEQFALTK